MWAFFWALYSTATLFGYFHSRVTFWEVVSFNDAVLELWKWQRVIPTHTTKRTAHLDVSSEWLLPLSCLLMLQKPPAPHQKNLGHFITQCLAYKHVSIINLREERKFCRSVWVYLWNSQVLSWNFLFLGLSPPHEWKHPWPFPGFF